MKIYSRVRTWILIVILLLVAAVQGVFTHSFTKKRGKSKLEARIKTAE